MPAIDPERLLADVGLRISEIRSEKAWIQQDLADQLEVTLRYIQRVEAGKANLTLRSLTEFANAFGVNVGALLTAPSTARRGAGRPRARE